MSGTKLHRVREIAAQLQVCERTVYQWIRDGKLEAVRFGSTIRVPEEAIQKMMIPFLAATTRGRQK